MQWNRDRIFLGLLLPLLLLLGFNRHSKHGDFNYHGELWADKAGYQVYLPALIYYHFNADEFPHKITRKVGSGFELHDKTNKVITKYPIGVAVLHSPFFMAGVLIDYFNPEAIKGYSHVQHKLVIVSSVFYVWIGLVLIFMIVKRQHSAQIGYLVLLLILISTNLLFYTTRDAGLSHAYSFAVVSGLLYLLDKHFKDLNYKALVSAVILTSIGCLIRPSNLALYATIWFIFLLMMPSNLWLRNVKFWQNLTVGIAIGLILPGLQLVYYNYAHGSYFAYAYSDESFIYALKPKITRVWFAPANGLFLYSPLFAIVLLCAIIHVRSTLRDSLLLIVPFLVVSYLYAAWWTPGLGCGYGHRGFVELIPLLGIPLATGLDRWAKSNWATMLGIVAVVYGAVLLFFQYRYDGCWYGNGYWDWHEILLILGW